jgi:hypothetical protein
VNYFLSAATLTVLFVTAATAGSQAHYIWRGWASASTDYMIVHSPPKKTTDNDFYLICHGSGQVGLTLRAFQSGGYALETETDVPTTFVFGRRRIAMTAALRGPDEMLGGVSVQYVFERDDPVLTAIARGEPFRVVLPKTTTQRFAPKAAKRFFADMAAHCKSRP